MYTLKNYETCPECGAFGSHYHNCPIKDNNQGGYPFITPQTQRQIEEERSDDTATAEHADISLTHIKNLETTIELLLEEAERRKEEVSCLHRQISDLQDQLAKSCCRSAGF